MKIRAGRLFSCSNEKMTRLQSKSPIGVAVVLALYGSPHTASADDQTVEQTPTLTEVVVTASRRQQTIEETPYSISVVSPTQIQNTGVTDIASLARQVPGVSMYDYGAQASGYVFPIIRGLNASPGSGGFRTFEQAPVGTYIGNSPIDGYFQLDDVQRVEVLRGPQGTLYGAGALGGALRIIPNAPELGKFAGDIEAGVGILDHASNAAYTTTAVLNIPIGESLAFRASGNYAYQPGFIDVYGILKSSGPLGIPVLANPADPVNSPGVFTGENDWNDQKTFTGRASLLWKPTENFNAQLAFTHAYVNGDGTRGVNPYFPGGPYVGDSRITFPAGSEYQTFSQTDAPYSRTTNLTSGDLSYDAGFATLSSTSSYFTTDGSTQGGEQYSIYRLPQYIGYYAGNPLNPRFVLKEVYADQEHTFTQELRLVSNTGPDKVLDYVVGLFYENQTRIGNWTDADPGSPERAAAQGCTGQYLFGLNFPNCVPMTDPGDPAHPYGNGSDLFIIQNDHQHFEDKSVFGELTWHFAKHAQITGGARHFEQSFTDTQFLNLYAYPLFVPPEARSTSTSKTIGKLDASYEYASGQYVYALWSQGFRRGGANAIPTAGAFADSPILLLYKPDTVNNYELGVKGHFANGVSYTFDAFDDQWNNPQVGGTTPATNFAVWNAKKAESRGVEFDLNSPLWVPGLSIAMSGAYSYAEFSEDYTIVDSATFGNIVGKAGQQLPGSPKGSAAATINYARNLLPGYDLTTSLNYTYSGKVWLTNFGILGEPPQQSEAVELVNLSASVRHQSWRMGIYVTNLMDKRVILSPGLPDPATNNLEQADIINEPREIYIRLGYSF
jgi:iron complex outermembrane receptor protein